MDGAVIIAIVLTAIVVGAIAVALWVYFTDQRGINARPRMELPKRERRYQDDFSLFLDTPAKQAKHRQEHSEWDIEFYGLIPAPQKIIWNGVEMALEEADKQYYRDEAINRMRLQQQFLGD
jgi:hypothetical protein